MTPKEALEAIKDNVNATLKGMGENVVVRGIMLEGHYGEDNYFIGLDDEKEASRIVLSASSRLSKEMLYALKGLNSGDVIEVGTYPRVGISPDGNLLLYFNINERSGIRRIEEGDISKNKRLDKELQEVMRLRPRPYDLNLTKMVRSNLLHFRRTPIAVITPEDSDGEADFMSVRVNKLFYKFTVISTRFNTEGLVAAIRGLYPGEYEAALLVRGGGSGLEQMDTPEVWKAVVGSTIPIIYASGHTRDNLRLRRVVDLDCPVPYHCATLLRDTAWNVVKSLLRWVFIILLILAAVIFYLVS